MIVMANKILKNKVKGTKYSISVKMLIPTPAFTIDNNILSIAYFK